MIKNLLQTYYISSILLGITHITFDIALVLYASSIYTETRLVGYLMLARTLPFLVLGPLIAQVVNKHDRKKIMIFASALDLVVNAIFCWVVYNNANSFGIFLILLGLNNTINSLFQVNQSSYLPTILSEEKLARYNSSIFFVESIAIIFAPNVTLLFPQPFLLILVIIMLFILQFFCFINSLFIVEYIKDDEISSKEKHQFTFTQSIRYTFSSKGLLIAMLILAIGNLLDAPMDTIMISQFTDQGDVTKAGWIFSAAGVGSLLGSLLVTLVSKNNRRLTNLMNLSAISMILSGIGLFTGNDYIYIISNFLLALGLSIRTIYIITYRQIKTPKRYLGSVNTLFKYIAFGISPISLWVFTQVSRVFTNTMLLYFCGLGFMVIGLVSIYATRENGELGLK